MRIMLLFLLLLSTSCASMDIAKVNIDTTKMNLNQVSFKSINYYISYDDINDKFLTDFTLSYDDNELRMQRAVIKSSIDSLIKQSFPGSAIQIDKFTIKKDAQLTFSVTPKYLISLLEYEKKVHVEVIITTRIFDPYGKFVDSFKTIKEATIPNDNMYSFLGVQEHYINFIWSDEINRIVFNGLSTALRAAIKENASKMSKYF